MAEASISSAEADACAGPQQSGQRDEIDQRIDGEQQNVISRPASPGARHRAAPRGDKDPRRIPANGIGSEPFPASNLSIWRPIRCKPDGSRRRPLQHHAFVGSNWQKS
jgi:hypothetical protein